MFCIELNSNVSASPAKLTEKFRGCDKPQPYLGCERKPVEVVCNAIIDIDFHRLCACKCFRSILSITFKRFIGRSLKTQINKSVVDGHPISGASLGEINCIVILDKNINRLCSWLWWKSVIFSQNIPILCPSY